MKKKKILPTLTQHKDMVVLVEDVLSGLLEATANRVKLAAMEGCIKADFRAQEVRHLHHACTRKSQQLRALRDRVTELEHQIQTLGAEPLPKLSHISVKTRIPKGKTPKEIAADAHTAANPA